MTNWVYTWTTWYHTIMVRWSCSVTISLCLMLNWGHSSVIIRSSRTIGGCLMWIHARWWIIRVVGCASDSIVSSRWTVSCRCTVTSPKMWRLVSIIWCLSISTSWLCHHAHTLILVNYRCESTRTLTSHCRILWSETNTISRIWCPYTCRSTS